MMEVITGALCLILAGIVILGLFDLAQWVARGIGLFIELVAELVRMAWREARLCYDFWRMIK